MKELIIARALVCSHLSLAGQKTPPARFLYELLGCSQSPSFAELGRAAADKGREKKTPRSFTTCISILSRLLVR